MKRAFLVIGPQSSGTKFWTRILINCGCVGMDTDHQRWDESHFEGSHVVWRCSVPHGPDWLAPIRLIESSRAQGYFSRAIVTTRDWFAMANSQVASRHVIDLAEAYRDIEQAHRIIFTALSDLGVPFVVSSYESSGNLKYRAELLALLDLKEGNPVQFIDGNSKHYISTDSCTHP